MEIPKNDHFVKIVKGVVCMLVELSYAMVFNFFSPTLIFSLILGI